LHAIAAATNGLWGSLGAQAEYVPLDSLIEKATVESVLPGGELVFEEGVEGY